MTVRVIVGDALEAGTWRELTRIVQRLRRAVPDLDLAVKNSDAVEAEMRRRGLKLRDVE